MALISSSLQHALTWKRHRNYSHLFLGTIGLGGTIRHHLPNSNKIACIRLSLHSSYRKVEAWKRDGFLFKFRSRGVAESVYSSPQEGGHNMVARTFCNTSHCWCFVSLASHHLPLVVSSWLTCHFSIHPKLQAEENSSSRDELAGVPVGALLSKKRGAAVEVYRSKTRQKIQPEFDNISGHEVTANGK